MTHLNLTKIAAGALIAVALLLGLYAWALSRHTAPPAPVVKRATPEAAFPVVVATRLLPAGAPIAGDGLRVVMLPMRPSGAFSDASLVTQRVPLSDIGANVPVLEAQLSSGFAEQVAPGERAVAVHIDEASAVGNRIRPGNFVDVFFTLKRDGASVGPNAEITRSQTRLLLSRVRVLAFGNTASGAGNPARYGVGVHTAVLAVPTADVDRLGLADSAGHVLLALRNPRDPEALEPAARERAAAVVHSSSRVGRGDGTEASVQAETGVSLSELSAGTAPVRTIARPGPRPIRSVAGIEVIRAGQMQASAN
ncbi:Flp pilus assembly protein CpaB [Trinickia sp. Y13]|uniref:Flp pilus assembly protein CpaB n=1 Tax=Trinickia sp. Y13 TaxID=2917807 RepID=UPI002405C471|nr:Flp pilus assembly protein CpaB [Trinickia sp. Y13]MDG0022845.1 Flp pilus assembly protein CpaB [Trinickia sp. Y13]